MNKCIFNFENGSLKKIYIFVYYSQHIMKGQLHNVFDYLTFNPLILNLIQYFNYVLPQFGFSSEGLISLKGLI